MTETYSRFESKAHRRQYWFSRALRDADASLGEIERVERTWPVEYDEWYHDSVWHRAMDWQDLALVSNVRFDVARNAYEAFAQGRY